MARLDSHVSSCCRQGCLLCWLEGDSGIIPWNKMPSRVDDAISTGPSIGSGRVALAANDPSLLGIEAEPSTNPGGADD